jgi:hypothetical protein
MSGKGHPAAPELGLRLPTIFLSERRRDQESLAWRLRQTATHLAGSGLAGTTYRAELWLDPSWYESALVLDGWNDERARARRIDLVARMAAHGERVPLGALIGLAIKVFLVADPVSRLAVKSLGSDPYLVVWSKAL